MPRPKKLVTTAAAIKDIDLDKIEELAFRGFRKQGHFAAELGISLAALWNRRDTDEDFRAKMDEAIARGQARKLGQALDMLWEKAEQGDRAAIITFVNRLDPDLAAMLPQRSKSPVSINDSDVVVLTGTALQEKLAKSREELRANRERIYVEESDGQES